MAWVKTGSKLSSYLATTVYCSLYNSLLYNISIVFSPCSTKNGLTALMRAARGGHNETVQTLIAAGADLNVQSDQVLLAIFVYCFMFTQLSLTTSHI